MFISFIVPVYNAEMYLEECLDSLLKQDLPYSEYEIICVNDGSTDKSLELLCEYKKGIPTSVSSTNRTQEFPRQGILDWMWPVENMCGLLMRMISLAVIF